MMHEIYIDILRSTILEQYIRESDFYETNLGLTKDAWEKWIKGNGNLSPEQNQKIKNLFSDYEWMLVQKVLRQTVIFPEKRNTAVTDYRLMKTKVAQKWLKNGLADVEIVDQETSQETQLLNLRVTVSFDKWGFDDILSFRLPAVIQQQIENEKIKLLDWVDENLAETYIHQEAE